MMLPEPAGRRRPDGQAIAKTAAESSGAGNSGRVAPLMSNLGALYRQITLY
jgi:hypothetical protein